MRSWQGWQKRNVSNFYLRPSFQSKTKFLGFYSRKTRFGSRFSRKTKPPRESPNANPGYSSKLRFGVSWREKSCVERICMTLDKIPVDIWDCLS